jgi:hypothetical protein
MVFALLAGLALVGQQIGTESAAFGPARLESDGGSGDMGYCGSNGFGLFLPQPCFLPLWFELSEWGRLPPDPSLPHLHRAGASRRRLRPTTSPAASSATASVSARADM